MSGGRGGRSAIGAALALGALLSSAPAEAFMRVASDGRVGVSALRTVIVTDGARTTWTIAAEVDANAKQVALLIFAPSAPTESVVLASLDPLLPLEELAAARIEELEALDPCVVGSAQDGPARVRHLHPRQDALRTKLSIEVVPAALDKWLDAHRVKLDEGSRKLAAKHVAGGGVILAAHGALSGPSRGAYLPLIRLEFDGAALGPAFGIAGAATPTGRVQRVELLTLHPRLALVPVGRAAEAMPSKVNLPEVALEDPWDLERALASFTARRNVSATVVRHHFEKSVKIPQATRTALGWPKLESANLARFSFEQGRNEALSPLVLEQADWAPPTETRFIVRRVWRKPINCAIAPRYQRNVLLQQQAELRAYSALTGRPLTGIAAESKRRGYSIHPDGSLTPIVEQR